MREWRDPKFEDQGSKFQNLERRTSNPRPSRSAILLGGWGRLDVVVGRQFRASQVGGEQRLNLAAQCVLNGCTDRMDGRSPAFAHPLRAERGER